MLADDDNTRSAGSSSGSGGGHGWPTNLPFEGKRSHPLKFDANAHKALEAELKLLYVAVTRAKSRLFIFDEGATARGGTTAAGAGAGSGGSSSSGAPLSEDLSARTAAFEWMQRQGLVEIALDSDVAGFAKESSAEEWRKKGLSFKKIANYKAAGFCFDKAGLPLEAQACYGDQAATDANEAEKGSPERKKLLRDMVRPRLPRMFSFTHAHPFSSLYCSHSPPFILIHKRTHPFSSHYYNHVSFLVHTLSPVFPSLLSLQVRHFLVHTLSPVFPSLLSLQVRHFLAAGCRRTTLAKAAAGLKAMRQPILAAKLYEGEHAYTCTCILECYWPIDYSGIILEYDFGVPLTHL